MSRKYTKELLDLLSERQEIINYKGCEVIVKLLPDSDEIGAMDPRLYHDMKGQLNLMKLMPKKMMQPDMSIKGIEKLRKMFNGIKSVETVERKIQIEHKSVAASDGYQIPIRIYNSETPLINGPMLYYIHGGGFFGGNPDVVEESVKLFVEKFDMTVVSVDYRLAPENPYPLGHEDCFSVLKWIGEHAEALKIDRKNIFVAGDSAGGNLTQYCSTRDIEENLNLVKGQMLLYPTLNMCGVEDEFFKWSMDEYEMTKKQKTGVTMMLDMFGGMSSGLEDILKVKDAHNDYLNPYTRDPKKNPVTFVTVGEHDYLKVETLSYAAKLHAAGIKVKAVVYKGFGHAYFDNCGVYPQCEDCIIEMGKFILENS